MTTNFNLSEWALRHRSFIWYFMGIFAVMGVVSYLNLGREEDPTFTIKTMLIQAQWPGASVDEMSKQVTERIERKLEELDVLDYTKSMTTPGQAIVFVYLRGATRGRDVPNTWVRVRNMINDIRSEFPPGVTEPAFNDNFGDVFGNIYAFTSDGLNQRQLRDYVERARRDVLLIPNVGKVDLIGAQDEVIFLEFSVRQIAALGLNEQDILRTIQEQNAIVDSGIVEAGPERVILRVGGQFISEESLRSINLRVNDRYFRLSDLVTITRGYADPPQMLFRVNGEPAIGLAIGMKAGANILHFGEALKEKMNAIIGELPIGVGVHQVSDQPVIVKESVGQFTRSLFEAVAIVLAVSFLSLGLRPGFVVALAIPLVLAMTFVALQYLGISLQRVSLGALIIALGLLVDDAMIAVEMMVSRLEIGDPLNKAATYVYTSTAFPMLTGTLVTVASFLPIGMNTSDAGEYTFSLFVVIAISLLLSWLVAVIFTPLLGVTLLPKRLKKKHDKKPSRVSAIFRRLLDKAMRRSWLTVAISVGLFAVSLLGLKLVQQQFFPSSSRNELVVDFTLPQNASIAATKAEMDRFEHHLVGDADVDSWSSYVGQGAIRFVLAFDVQMANANYGQIIIVAKNVEARDRLKARLREIAHHEFIGIDIQVELLPLGPPAGRPVQYRVSGPDIQKVREFAQQLAAKIGSHPLLEDIGFNWMEPARVVKLEVLQDKARQLGVTSAAIAQTLNSVVGGATVTQVRDDIYLVKVLARARGAERGSIETLQNLQLMAGNGKAIPLAAVANFRYELEQPLVWRRSRLPTVTVQAGILGPTQPATVLQQLSGRVDEFKRTLPAGYRIEIGGPVEESAKSQGPIAAVIPLMLFAMATILMVQLQSIQRLFLVLAVAPLGLIGVVAGMLLSGSPLGFVAILGVLALIGILIRNSVILIVQIEEHRREGMATWDAVLDATMHRTRPIMLTAAAASLALIPIAREGFWAPMACAMMGGIIVGTLLTLLFLPALYVAWFRVKPPVEAIKEASPTAPHPAESPVPVAAN
jgi:multidrug efflux pump subunit AcrB